MLLRVLLPGLPHGFDRGKNEHGQLLHDGRYRELSRPILALLLEVRREQGSRIRRRQTGRIRGILLHAELRGVPSQPRDQREKANGRQDRRRAHRRSDGANRRAMIPIIIHSRLGRRHRPRDASAFVNDDTARTTITISLI